MTNIILVSQVRLITNISSLICKAFQGKHLFSITIHFYSRRVTDSAITRLQNSPYFCVFKYARAVKQKVWNEAENRGQDSYATLYRFLYWFWEKNQLFCSLDRLSFARVCKLNNQIHRCLARFSKSVLTLGLKFLHSGPIVAKENLKFQILFVKSKDLNSAILKLWQI